MQVPAVSACVGAISEPMGTLPLKLYRRLEGGGKEAAIEHPIYSLVHDAASDWQSAGAFREQLTVDALLSGNGYGLKITVDDRPFELVRLDPRAMRVELVGGEPVYRYGSGTSETIYRYQDIIHIPALSVDGTHGKAPIALGKNAIAFAHILNKHGVEFFSKGARPSGVLESEKNLDAEGVEKISKALAAQATGDAVGSALILPDGFKFNPLSFNSTDSQFLELRRQVTEEIARVFRMPPTLIGDLSRATWSNAESMNRQYLQALQPWMVRWQNALSRTLLTKEERKVYFFEFVTEDLLKADYAAQVEGLTKLITARVLNPNEVRSMAFNLPPYDGGDQYANPNTSSPSAPPPANENRPAEAAA